LHDSGLSYFHSILLSILLSFLVDPVVAGNLSEPSLNWGDRVIATEKGSCADLMMGVLVDFCFNPEFWPSFVCALHRIVPYTSSFSRSTAEDVVTKLQQIIEGQPLLTPLALEALALIVQKENNENNAFLVSLVQQSRWLRSLQIGDPKSKRALAILIYFVKHGSRALKKDQRNQFYQAEVLHILQSVKIPQNIQIRPSSKYPRLLGRELEGAWRDWTNILFVRSFGPEMVSFLAFQAEYDPTLAMAIAQARK
jgi:hypothetical protein